MVLEALPDILLTDPEIPLYIKDFGYFFFGAIKPHMRKVYKRDKTSHVALITPKPKLHFTPRRKFRRRCQELEAKPQMYLRPNHRVARRFEWTRRGQLIITPADTRRQKGRVDAEVPGGSESGDIRGEAQPQLPVVQESQDD